MTILYYLSKIVLTEIEVRPFMEHLVRSKVDKELKIYRKGVTWHNVDPKMMAGPVRHLSCPHVIGPHFIVAAPNTRTHPTREHGRRR